MENIMEQLLLFSSEQALQNIATRAPAAPSTTNQALHSQVVGLTMQVERQNEVERSAQMQIEKLREQVDRLARMVQAGSHQTQRGADRPGPEMEIEFEENH